MMALMRLSHFLFLGIFQFMLLLILQYIFLKINCLAYFNAPFRFLVLITWPFLFTAQVFVGVNRCQCGVKVGG
jgi:hypothetical protein